MYLDDLNSMVNSELTPIRLSALFSGISAGYRQRATVVEQFPDRKIGRQYWPQYRRAAIESAMLLLEDRGVGISTKLVSAAKGDACYVEIQLGRLLLVECITRSPNDLPRRATSRYTLARDGQLRLFDENSSLVPLMNSRPDIVFGVLAHYPSKEDHTKPAFVRLQIPDPECSRIIVNRDLLEFHASKERGSTPQIVIPTAISIKSTNQQ